MLLIESEMPVNKVARIFSVNPNRIWNVFNYWISKAHTADQIEELEKIGFDETSVKKGHNYVTTMVDLKERRVLFATEGKDAQTIAESTQYLKQKNVDVEKVKQICIDMSPAFISGCEQHLPNASITFDRFHVVKEVNKAMDELRKAERRGKAKLKGHKYSFLKNKISAPRQMERDLLLESYPKLGEGYRLKKMFNDFWDIKDKEEAQSYLVFWCDMVDDSEITTFIKASKTIKVHWDGIINYIESRINNGILEGLNSKI